MSDVISSTSSESVETEITNQSSAGTTDTTVLTAIGSSVAESCSEAQAQANTAVEHQDKSDGPKSTDNISSEDNNEDQNKQPKSDSKDTKSETKHAKSADAVAIQSVPSIKEEANSVVVGVIVNEAEHAPEPQEQLQPENPAPPVVIKQEKPNDEVDGVAESAALYSEHQPPAVVAAGIYIYIFNP